MVTFLALYRGRSFATAEVLGVTSDPELVADIASWLLERCPPAGGDAVLDEKHRSQQRTLRLLRSELRHRVRKGQ